MGCCGSSKKKEEKKKEQYKCEPCGATSDNPKDCCGKPMKKVKQGKFVWGYRINPVSPFISGNNLKILYRIFDPFDKIGKDWNTFLCGDRQPYLYPKLGQLLATFFMGGGIV